MEEKQSNKERFIQICSQTIKREGIDKLLSWLEKSDFYTAPASTRFHGNYTGGLVEHSLNVYDELKRLLSAYPEIKATDETVAIISLFHDLCKVNFYVIESGHGSKSVFIVQKFIKLTAEEGVAINCYMGSWDGNKDVGKAYEQFSLAWLLHVADESASYIIEGGK